MRNILTIDVEDWFQVEALKKCISYHEWNSCESRVLSNVLRVLKFLDENKAKATFFILGWVAERLPQVVLEINRYGHEIASHGYAHRVVYEQKEIEFKDDMKRSLAVLERLIKKKVIGYRAPNFSITDRSLWAYEILAELGIEYSSSVFPTKHIFQIYGLSQAPRFPFVLNLKNGSRIREFPLSTVEIFGRPMPFGGGAYLRIMPHWYNKWGIKKINQQGHPAIVYFHPWEIDPLQPKQNLGVLGKFRHYYNLDIMELKIRMLLRDFQFGAISEFL
ncbi:MAG: XrtA system polysaccharide deacetylase [Candidatus Zixiibacteriota bacterium]